MTIILEAHGMEKSFRVKGGTVRALRGVDLAVREGETLALVGESGCGKSTLARALALIDPPDGGTLLFDGLPLNGLGRRALRPFRRALQMVFQDPYGSLNPRLAVGAIVAEPLVIHGIGSAVERRQAVAELLEAVGLHPEDANRYPHEFSGGQRQRIAIARALAPAPRIIVADEPVSALDVSVQSQILNLLLDLQEQRRIACLFIGHDLAVVRHIAHRVAVMYLGTIVEEGPADALFSRPRHPYTSILLAAAPRVGRRRPTTKILPGDPPSPLSPPPGCAFHPRCPLADVICRDETPVLEETDGGGHRAACHFSHLVPSDGNPWEDRR
ncbi:MAG: ATP-binding cassette domain-containing protein [Magnetospirillum sp. WYHS-4]